MFRAVRDAARATYSGAVFSPALFDAGTSLYPWTSRGVPGYGVYPYVLDNDQLIAMHGNGERMREKPVAATSAVIMQLFAARVA